MKKDFLINSHVHSTASDGKLAPEGVIKEAVSEGVGYICFCDHYKRPPELRKRKGRPELNFDYEGYVKEIALLAEKYKGEIEVGFGTEMDWFDEFENWTACEIERYGNRYDLVIGSIHYLKIDGEYFPIDFSPETWEEISERFGMRVFVEEYYKQVRAMIESGLFDCVGHFDLIKINNEGSKFFCEEDDWYRDEVLRTLDVASEAGICIEVNTHGFKKKIREQYPSEWILVEAKKRNIPVTTSSDAHWSGEISNRLVEMVEILKKIGYKSIVKFRGHGMVEVGI